MLPSLQTPKRPTTSVLLCNVCCCLVGLLEVSTGRGPFSVELEASSRHRCSLGAGLLKVAFPIRVVRTKFLWTSPSLIASLYFNILNSSFYSVSLEKCLFALSVQYRSEGTPSWASVGFRHAEIIEGLVLNGRSLTDAMYHV